MKKKRLIIILLLFFFLTSLEAGIFIEVLWHGWGGYGDIAKEYVEIGSIGAAFLVFFIAPSIVDMNPIFQLGRRMTAFLIDLFIRMEYPIP